MKKTAKTNVIIFSVVWLIAIILAFAISYVSGFSFWLCMGLVVIGFVVNSFIAELEDRMAKRKDQQN